MTEPARRPPDLLVQGDDTPPRRPIRGLRVLVVAVPAVLVVVAAAVSVGGAQRAEDERTRAAAVEADVLRLSLRPGQDRAPRYGPRRPGVHVVVRNDGPADVQLLSGRLLPGSWQVGVPDRRRLRSGRSVVLELVPPAGCAVSRPRLLRLQAELGSGRVAASVLDVTGARLAYGGGLDDALAAAQLTCDPDVPPPPDRRTYPHVS